MQTPPISRPIRALLIMLSLSLLPAGVPESVLAEGDAAGADAEATAAAEPASEPAAADGEGEAQAAESGDADVPNPDARRPVVTLEDVLLEVMKKAEELGFEGRLREITPAVESTFDLEFMAKTSIGRTWKELTPEVQQRWVESFKRYTTTKLADQFDKYSGQQFVLKGERPASRGTLIVMSSVERPGKDDVRLDFRVRPAGEGEWLIIDIYGKGKVSEVALRRSEYAAILKESGIDGLISSVDELSERTAEKASE